MQKTVLHHLWTEIQICGYAGRMSPPGGSAHPKGLVFLSYFDFECFKKDEKKKPLCTQDIWRERWKTSVLLGLRSMPVWKNKVLHALDFVSINLLFRGKHKCFGRQLLWRLFLELFIKLWKALSLLTVGALLFLQQEGEETQVCSFIMLIIFCPVTSFWPSNMLKFGRARALLLCNGGSSHLSLITLANVSRLDFSSGAPGLLSHLAPAVWLQQLQEGSKKAHF